MPVLTEDERLFKDWMARIPASERREMLAEIERERRQKMAIRYFDPQEQQWPIFRKFTHDIKIMGVLGGNRGGKSACGAFMTVAWCLGKDYFFGEPAWEVVKDLPIPEPPVSVWVVALDFSMLKSVIWEEKFFRGTASLPPLIPEEEVKGRSDFHKTIEFRNGSILQGKSSDSGARKFQGPEKDLIWIDEECDRSVYDECYQRTTSGRGGKILVTMTPLTAVDEAKRRVSEKAMLNRPWIADLYKDWEGGAPHIHFEKITPLENPYVPETERELLLKKWGGTAEGKARLYGDIFRRSGLVYPSWDRNVHLVPPFRIPHEWTRVACIDPASTGPTAVLWAAVDPSTSDLIFYREYKEREKTVPEHAIDIRMKCGGESISHWMIDPKGGTVRTSGENHKSLSALYRERGIPVRPATIDPDWGLEVSAEYLQRSVEGKSGGAYFFSSLSMLRDEIENYVIKSTTVNGRLVEKPRKHNDHLMNCFQYICCSRPKSMAPRPQAAPDPSVNSYSYRGPSRIDQVSSQARTQ